MKFPSDNVFKNISDNKSSKGFYDFRSDVAYIWASFEWNWFFRKKYLFLFFLALRSLKIGSRFVFMHCLRTYEKVFCVFYSSYYGFIFLLTNLFNKTWNFVINLHMCTHLPQELLRTLRFGLQKKFIVVCLIVRIFFH